jgi:acetyl esterase/lipase
VNRSETQLLRPPFDRELEIARNTVLEQVPTAVTIDRLAQSRANVARATVPVETVLGDRPIMVEHHTVPPGPETPEVTVSVLRKCEPEQAAPAVFYLHGGGFMFGNRFGDLDMVADWVDELGVVGVSVDYRLAPEHPYPAPLEDCYAALVWAADHAGDLGIDRDRIILAGLSSGGGLAAGLALLARDRGGPALAGQLLIGPMLDDRNNTLSAEQFVGVGMWDRTSNETGWTAYLGADHATADISPHASPARATDLTGLPSTYLDCGST